MSSQNPPDLLQQLTADLRAIVTEVERLTGLKSVWSGRVVLGNDTGPSGLPLYFGAKPWNCDVVLHQSRLSSPARYSTLLHETFHSVSAGLNKRDYDILDGYEEAVVEQCTRLFRAVVFSGAGLPEPVDARVSYSDKIALLEALRQRTQKAEQDFYLELLKTPLRDRETTILQWIQTIETTKTRPQIEQETLAYRAGLKP